MPNFFKFIFNFVFSGKFCSSLLWNHSVLNKLFCRQKFWFHWCLYRFVFSSFVQFRSSQMFTWLCLQSNKVYYVIKQTFQSVPVIISLTIQKRFSSSKEQLSLFSSHKAYRGQLWKGKQNKNPENKIESMRKGGKRF
jgi:hypothetical protein